MGLRNLKVKIGYCGAAYHGFQRQNNAVSVQSVLEECLSRLTGSTTKINGCSRTDTGVHANEFFFSFKTECGIPCDGLVRGMNSLLPCDIAVYDCTQADDDFHARYSCKGKEYVYKFLNTPVRDPFLDKKVFHYPYKMNIELINSAAEKIVGTHDFSAFCGSLGAKENSVRTVYDCRVEKTDIGAELIVSGDGFLYNMVRIIAGTLIYVNEGKLAPEDITAIIESCDRNRAGITAKPDGLYLNRVFY